MAQKTRIWDKQEVLYLMDGTSFSNAQEMGNYTQARPDGTAYRPFTFALIPTMDIVINHDSVLTEVSPITPYKERLRGKGVDLSGLSGQQILDTLEQIEADEIKNAPPSAEERIAAAMEFQNIMSL